MKKKLKGSIAAATAIALGGVLALAGSTSASAYCASPALAWAGSSLNIRNSTGTNTSWDGQLNLARQQWNGIPGASWTLNFYASTFVGPVGSPLVTVRVVSSAPPGYGGAPAVTNLVYSGSTITGGDVYFNSAFTWSSVGTMNQASMIADRRTVGVHEFGHEVYLNHPNACGPMDASEIASSMNPNWTTKLNTNADDKAGAAFRK